MIPKPIYELLPYTYIGAGSIAVISVESIFGKVCGLLLTTVGIVIYQTRRRYRHRKVGLGNAAANRIQANANNQVNPPNNNGKPVNHQLAKWRETFQKGENSYEQGDYAAALKWYRKAAEQGYAPAQVNLGSMYFEGHGVASDFQEALKWYRKAADQGYASAQFDLGMLYEQGGSELLDLGEALRWYCKAAEQGYAPAQVNLGAMYAAGQGVPPDLDEALRWYRQAASQGYALAQFNLGIIYAEGEKGIPQDLVMAYVWFSRAAVMGDTEAQGALNKVARRLTAQQKARAQQLLLLQTSSTEPVTSRTQRSTYA